MKCLATLLSGAAFIVATAGTASAVTLYASEVHEVNPGAGQRLVEEPDRYIPTNALGPQDNIFYSLGLSDEETDEEGSIVLGFGGATFGASSVTSVWEVTFDLTNYGEAVDVYAAIWDGASVTTSELIGRVVNNDSQTGETLNWGGGFDANALYLVDATLDEFGSTNSYDGFDVDAVSVSGVIPLPATGLLLLGGVAGLGLVRRKRS